MKRGTKYYPLFEYLEGLGRQDTAELSFAQIEGIIEAPLPASARKSRSWWANSSGPSRVQAAAWMEAGYHVSSVDLEQERVTFVRPKPPYHLVRDLREMEWNAETIRALRQHMGLTQKEFASRLNMRQQTISEWETGLYKPRGGSIALLNMVAERAGFYKAIAESADQEGEPKS
ncbi:MAG: helix-turn-helix domain-containing protein [Chloroflexi bacterium]|nr:MAG: helix-turn-helix domain-containing protein [Chloroflexota bacterium]